MGELLFFAGRANRKGAFDMTQPRIVQASTGKDAAGKMCEIMWSKNGGCEKRINLERLDERVCSGDGVEFVGNEVPKNYLPFY